MNPRQIVVGAALALASLLTNSVCTLATYGSENEFAKGCGYPERVRDGLHPYQYFSLAKVYLSDLRLGLARECVDKLKACEPTHENVKLVTILENSYLPKNPVPADVLVRLNYAANLLPAARMSDAEKASELREIYKDLVSKYPNFEWPYFLATSWREGSSIDGLKKVLAINPNNVEALHQLAECYRGEHWAEAYECAKKAKELDPFRSGLDVDFFRTITGERVGGARDVNSKARSSGKKSEQKTAAKAASPPPPLNIPKARKYVEKAYKFVDKTGRNVFYVGPNVHTVNKFSDGLLLVNAAEGRGSFQSNDVQYWNKEGDSVFSLDRGDASSASEGRCGVQTMDSIGRTRWGFVDHQGKTVVPPTYNEVIPFQNGRSAVQVSVSRPFYMTDFWGFIDPQGVYKVEPIYDHCLPFTEDLAGVAINGKVGFINKEGFLVVQPKFDYARPFSEGLSNVLSWNAETRIVRDQYIDTMGNVVLSDEYKIPKDQSLSEAFRIDHFLFPEQYSYKRDERLKYRWCDFHDGLVARRKLVKPNVWRAGFMDRNGKLIIPATFDEVEAFCEGLARVKVGGRFGYIDAKGKQVIAATYTEATDFSDGLAAVSTDGEVWGYIDKTGKEVIAEKYLEANQFSDGLAKVGVPK